METEKRVGKLVHISQLLPEQLKEPVSFDEVELTAEESEKAIQEAKMKKAVHLEDERRKRLAIAMQEEMLKPWNAHELWQHARSRGNRFVQMESGDQRKDFQMIEFQKPLIKALSLYFTGDPAFESLDTALYNEVGIPFSLNKGLWLWGNPGVGKTLLMQMFRINKRLCYVVVQCPKIAFGYQRNGDEHISHYSKVLKPDQVGMSKSYDNFHQEKIGVCYNDLGTEQLSSKHYGNSINVMENIFLETYENKVPWFHRHVTTNLDFNQVGEHYGLRVKDRIRQCFNILEINGNSLRK